jgi:hypothetical protein
VVVSAFGYDFSVKREKTDFLVGCVPILGVIILAMVDPGFHAIIGNGLGSNISRKQQRKNEEVREYSSHKIDRHETHFYIKALIGRVKIAIK